ncbi:MAG: prepilin-type N-terminal cleavage/methylation domain-containing protein [Gammaproteobacteria bacterium]|jgi:prepilin-type N-terminal cleavage/methylation domain-containing protein|nr:prepilin-type N-terminal cleavage/methylation domain-containing protein [Gammaproteobacteria bacterium]MDH3751914.1 prepilin-type N-terminal cleavage/methylation domain-containing protein [Gammaproteobacteria bacterium]MDH3806587.1 prepilin-type N-terminal cleavage/methylation domain-containing protein [Gammaproteobacteria bacterium]
MNRHRQEHGLTLVEVLVTIVLLTIVLVPAMRALQTGVVGAGVHGDVSSSHYRLTSRLEELLAEPFADLSDAAIAAGAPTTATTYSEAAGPPGRLLVYLSLYDGDNTDADDNPFTGTDPDLLWIRVEIEDSVHTLQTIRASGY